MSATHTFLSFFFARLAGLLYAAQPKKNKRRKGFRALVDDDCC